MIRTLPSVLINQIAAGEVVDRPASIVKELVENSIDAGSTRIDVQIEHGGRDLIRVSDNGTGIAPDELILALSPHATSKIAEESDLAAIASLGFRGEALASIGSISHIILTSRRKIEEAGTRIEIDGGKMTDPMPIAASVGTIVEVRRLFFNTPARRKFLKSDGAETTRVRDVIQRIAASHHDVTFTFKSGDKTLLEYLKSSSQERILSIFGGELKGEMLELEGKTKGITLWGLIGTPNVARPTAKHIRFHVNGRSIVDSSMTHALKEAFRGLIEPKRWPTAALFLEMDPALVDVNVHPQKSEVRFRDKDVIWRLVNKTVAGTLAAHDIVPTYLPSSTSVPFGSGRQSAQAGFGGSQHSSFLVNEARSALSDIDLPMSKPLPTILGSDAVLQVHKCFLVMQDEQGLLIIDQHALHERMMFNEFMKRLSKGNLESQRLLVPDAFQANANQLAAIEENACLLEKLGIDATASGPASISVYALPSLLVSRNVDGATFIRDLLDTLGRNDFPSGEEEALAEIVDMMSCKAAVKAGDHLTQRELGDLLQKREEIERSVSCPHGRPTTMRLSIDELERRFGRK